MPRLPAQRRRARMRRRTRFNRVVAGYNKIYSFKRTYQGTTFTGTPGASSFESFSFKLNDLPGYTDFTNLFDNYRIVKVVIRMYPQANSLEFGSDHYMGAMYSAIDTTDDTVPSSLTEIMELENCRSHDPSKPFTVKFKPSISPQIYDGLLTPGYGTSQNNWIQTSSDDIPYYGWKLGLSSQANLTHGTYFIPIITLHIECKNVK